MADSSRGWSQWRGWRWWWHDKLWIALKWWSLLWRTSSMMLWSFIAVTIGWWWCCRWSRLIIGTSTMMLLKKGGTCWGSPAIVAKIIQCVYDCEYKKKKKSNKKWMNDLGWNTLYRKRPGNARLVTHGATLGSKGTFETQNARVNLLVIYMESDPFTNNAFQCYSADIFQPVNDGLFIMRKWKRSFLSLDEEIERLFFVFPKDGFLSQVGSTTNDWPCMQHWSQM